MKSQPICGSGEYAREYHEGSKRRYVAEELVVTVGLLMRVVSGLEAGQEQLLGHLWRNNPPKALGAGKPVQQRSPSYTWSVEQFL